ncbi:helix-turn-helix transcriptional regulator [Halobaculum halobium]|uniref:Helix-turn-helix transcriptional regulator n=1 Tax=Halobaculum halobium TaxID=3032281 RepID=A0ABD5TEQ0_9EURY|nr:hypothetical protein [Halobaculum sp. SYNS20]
MRYVALLAVLAVLVSFATGATAAAAVQPVEPSALADQPASDGAAQAITSPTDSASPQLASTVGAPRTNFTISLREDGDARWTVETRIALDDESTRDAFEEYARSYEAGDASGGPAVDPFRNAAAAASEATGREMSIERVNRTATLSNQSGVLRLRFTWTRFLEPGDDGVLELGDAFRTPNNGTWFGSLSASQRLVIEPPADYEVSDVSQGFSYSISDRRIVAEGPQQFGADDIAIRYEPGDSPPDTSYLLELIAGAGVVLLFAVAVLAYRRGNVAGARSGGGTDGAAGTEAGPNQSGQAPRGMDDGTDGGSDGVDGDREEGPSTAPSGPATDRDGSDTAVAGGAAAGDGPTETPSDSGGGSGEDAATEREEDLELLSDEERVERLLGEHGGRMRQGTIVDETGWSDAKVSQLLSAMADDERVEKLRLGRENIISLADGDDAGDETGADAESS